MSIDHDLRVRIEDMFQDYAFAIGDDNVEAWPDFFTDDGHYRITTRESVQRGLPMALFSCRGIGQIRDRVMALRKANIFEPHNYNHILSRPRFSLQADGSIAGRTNFVVYRTMHDGPQSRFAVGCYRDVIVEEGSAPKLKERSVVLDSRQVDVLLVYPI
jgi:anthranilate 1,2-dioxygenase small subunit